MWWKVRRKKYDSVEKVGVIGGVGAFHEIRVLWGVCFDESRGRGRGGSGQRLYELLGGEIFEVNIVLSL